MPSKGPLPVILTSPYKSKILECDRNGADKRAALGLHITDLSLSSLSEIRKEESFNTFYESLNNKVDFLDVNEPTLPRRSKMLKRFEIGNTPPEFTASEKDI
jgi:hypothetical protein